MDLNNEDANSAAANRIINGVSGTISLAAGSGRADLEYDGVTERWRVVNHEQGAWLVPAYSAGDFTGNGSMTWTVDSGDIQSYAYHLRGRTLGIVFEILSTSVGGTPNTRLLIKIPAGFTAARIGDATFYYLDNGTRGVGRMFWANGSTQISLSLLSAGNWSAATNVTGVMGQLLLDVQ